MTAPTDAPGAPTGPEFHLACRLGELEEDTPKRVVLGETPVSVVLTEGEVYAIHDICSHANVSLSEGEVEDCTIECWLHGSAFDLRTGKPSSLPAVRPVPVYPVTIDGEGPDAQVRVSLTPADNAVQES